MPELLGDIWPGLPQLRVLGKQPAFLLEGIEQVICGNGIILRDVEPDIDQILFGLGGLLKTAMTGDYRSLSASRLRAACLISSMELYCPRPLSTPSRHNWRSSSIS